MTGRSNVTDILCIGCQKGSTSWLHSVLACHPDTWSFPDSEPVTSTDKEAHFWDWNHARGADWYRALMTPPDPALKSMDFTPEYAFLPASQIAECRALSPTAKVIYVLRDPLARAVSALRMQLLWHRGKDWDGELGPGPDLEFFVAEARLADHGAYMANLARWRAAYPDLIVLDYEDFHRDRSGQVMRLMTRLGLDPGAITGDGAARLERLMQARIWKSEPYRISRGALLFLHGLTEAWRQEVEAGLNIRFTEGARLLDGG